MAAVNFNAKLKHLVKEILKYPLTHHVSLALDQSYINTFHEFRTIDVDNVYTFTYKEASAKPDAAPSKLHLTLVKAIQRCVHYCQFLQDDSHTDCDNPAQWVFEAWDVWKRHGLATYLATVAAAAVPTAVAGVASLPFVPTTQKDDDAALVSWNRKPRDVSKYPILMFTLTCFGELNKKKPIYSKCAGENVPAQNRHKTGTFSSAHSHWHIFYKGINTLRKCSAVLCRHKILTGTFSPAHSPAHFE